LKVSLNNTIIINNNIDLRSAFAGVNYIANSPTCFGINISIIRIVVLHTLQLAQFTIICCT